MALTPAPINASVTDIVNHTQTAEEKAAADAYIERQKNIQTVIAQEKAQFEAEQNAGTKPA